MENEVQVSQPLDADKVDESIDAQPGTTIALPRTTADLIANRKMPMKLTLNDKVESIHLSLWENVKYQKYLDAVYHEQAVEGRLDYDDFRAGCMIQEYAEKNGDPYVASQNLSTIVRALGVVLRRFRISRKERRETGEL